MLEVCNMAIDVIFLCRYSSNHAYCITEFFESQHALQTNETSLPTTTTNGDIAVGDRSDGDCCDVEPDDSNDVIVRASLPIAVIALVVATAHVLFAVAVHVRRNTSQHGMFDDVILVNKHAKAMFAF